MQRITIDPVQKIDSKTMEEIKKLRTNICFLDPVAKVINITSTVGKEGKSLISFWLAYSLTDLGKKVVLLDGNLRAMNKGDIYTTDKDIVLNRIVKKKRIHNKDSRTDNNINLQGLSDYLLGRIRKEEVITDTSISKFDIILSGKKPPNPSELLSGFMLKDLIIYLKENYDYIIIDTPALGEVTDASIIATHCDSSILVVEPGVTSYKLAQNVIMQLKNSGTKLLGVVLNKA